MGDLEAGIVANVLGAPFAVITGGLGCLLAVALIWRLARPLRDYDGRHLREPVDRFFVDVLVMTDDAKLRTARLELLTNLRDTIRRIADLAEIAPAERSGSGDAHSRSGVTKIRSG